MNRSFSETLQLCPELADCFQQFHQCVWQQSYVPQSILELCRLRIAQLLSAELDLSVRYKPTLACLSANKVSQLSRYYQSEEFSKLERDCIELAECFVLDPATITDEMASSVITHMGDAGYVALLEACGVFEGFTRFRLVLHCHSLNDEYVHQAAQTEFFTAARKESAKAARMRVKAASSASQSMVRNSPLNLVPETLDAFLLFYQTLWQGSYLRPAELEVGRLRNASLVNCTFCKATRFDVAQDDGLNEQRALAALGNKGSDPLQERDALIVAWVEHFLLKPSTPDLALEEAMTADFSAPEQVALTIGLALFMCFSKFAVAMGGLPDELPVMVSPVPS
jgi:alkylhydroperoxidase family enzyme